MSYLTTSPSPRAQRGRWRAVGVSLVCIILGVVAFTINFGLIAELLGDTAIDTLSPLLLLDLAVGLGAAIAVGPIRRSTVGNALVLVVGALSAFALPAVAVALVRFGERRSWKLDAVLVVIVAVSSVGVDLWHSHLLGEAPMSAEIALVAGVVALALLLWGRARGTRAALITSLRDQAVRAEHARAAVAQSSDIEVAFADPPESITDREWEVARFVAQGMTNAEIAAALYLSETTVKTHLKSVFAKLHVTNRVQLAIRVLEHNTQRSTQSPPTQ